MMARIAAFLPLAISIAALLPGAILADVPADLVKQVPGFEKHKGFKVYSGYLQVAGPVAGYDSLAIHYGLHTSMRDPAKDPLVTWHQGGPGGSSLYGAYTEMGYFQVDDNGTHTNDQSWNRVANMLYLESPAGSDDPLGFSTCSRGGHVALSCSWNDTSQAEAYAHTLASFVTSFPEFKENDLYLTGESYAGQYVPNIAHYIVNHEPFKSGLNLKGIAVGNGCWGGTATDVTCNGPNAEQNDIDMYFGKGLVSKRTYKAVYAACDFPMEKISVKCGLQLEKATAEVGPHNIYDIYDNCPATDLWLKKSGKTMRWLKNHLRSQMNGNVPMHVTNAGLLELSGGYDWSCGGMDAMHQFFLRPDVQTAMHLGKPGRSKFNYRSSGPASVTLYPELVTKLRVLIYNGDSDACVPYVSANGRCIAHG